MDQRFKITLVRKYKHYQWRKYMTKKNWIISISIGVLGGIILGLIGIPKLLQVKPVLADSQVDEVLAATLSSYQKWKSVEGEATIIWYEEDGGTQEYENTFSIQQPNSVKISVVSKNGKGISSEWVSDGSSAYGLDSQTSKYTGGKLPEFSKDFSLLPKTVAAARDTDVIYRHPFGMIIPSPISDYIYPQWFAQGGGKFELVEEDSMLDRKVWVVSHKKNSNDVTAWIDQETGMILKYSQLVDGKPFKEVTFTKIAFNGDMDSAVFSIPSDALTQ